MYSTATTVEAYLADLPDDRRQPLTSLRAEILRHLPAGYEEAMNWGMITYQVPLSVYPDTYNNQPLPLVSLASQKNHMAIYLMAPEITEGGYERLENAFAEAGKKLQMGKSCITFRNSDEIVLEPIMDIIARTDMPSFVAAAKEARSTRKSKP